MQRTILAVCALLFLVTPVWALPGEVMGPAKNPSAFNSTATVQTSVVLNTGGKAVAPGDLLVAAVIFDMDDGWHLNTHVLDIPPVLGKAEYYYATDVTWDLPADSPLKIEPQRVQWPEHKVVKVAFTGEAVDYKVYSGRAVVYIPIEVASDAEPGEVELTFKLTFQACDDQQCKAPVTNQPIRTAVPIVTLQDKSLQPPLDPQDDEALAELFAGFDPAAWSTIEPPPAEAVKFDLFGWTFSVDAQTGAGFVALLLVAAVGGFLLNLTPCVLPVIPIKIMGLSYSAGNRGRCLLLGATMSFGVVVFWMVLAFAITSVTQFDAINQLFQKLWFTVGVGVIIAIMGLGMCGLFSVALPRAVYQFSPKHDTLVGSFFFGIMTAVLATPCTAPFMGSAAAWSLTQPASSTLLTFAAIGIGMAAPYLVLSAFPSLVEKMPRVGPVSELIKQVMGLLLLAAAAFFIGAGLAGYLSEPPQPVNLGYWWVVMALIAAAGAWLVLRVLQLVKRPGLRVGWSIVGLVLIVAAVLGGRGLTDRGPIDWVYYTPEKLAEALDGGDVVVMDFTAEWCLNCKTLEHQVLFTDAVADALDQPGVTAMKVDITSEANVEGAAMLKKTGEVAIPLLVVFAPGNDGKIVFKSAAYTAGQVIEAIEAAKP